MWARALDVEHWLKLDLGDGRWMGDQLDLPDWIQ